MSISFTWLGQGMTLIEYSSGPSVLIDPAYHDNPFAEAAPDLGRISATLLTSGGDRSPQAIRFVAQQSSAPTVAHPTVCRWVAAQTGERTEPLHRGGTLELGDLRITMVRADHTYDMKPSADAEPVFGEGVGYVLRHPAHPTIYVGGRTNVFGDMSLIKQLYAPEIAVMSVGGRFSMGPEEAAMAAELLGVTTVFPTHYMSDYEDPRFDPLSTALGARGGNLYPLHPGDAFAL